MGFKSFFDNISWPTVVAAVVITFVLLVVIGGRR
jgi:hypothetical protein